MFIPNCFTSTFSVVRLIVTFRYMCEGVQFFIMPTRSLRCAEHLEAFRTPEEFTSFEGFGNHRISGAGLPSERHFRRRRFRQKLCSENGLYRAPESLNVRQTKCH